MSAVVADKLSLGRAKLTGTSPYVVSLALTVLISSYANYVKDRLDPTGFSLWGQAPGIYLPILLFPITLLLWLRCVSSVPRRTWTGVFLAGLGFSWVTHFALMRLHGDLYPHTIWIFPIVLMLLAMKPPTPQSAWLALRILAWGALMALVLTFLLEQAELIPAFTARSASIVDFEVANYWLPLRDIFGLDGRWHGPYGHATKTAFIGSFIATVAVADRGWQKWLLLTGGIITLMLTAGRGGYLSLLAALGVLFVFARTGPASRIPIAVRVIASASLGSLGAIALFFLSSLGFNGRMQLWQGFLNLWNNSLLVGVGQTGIAQSPQIVPWMEPSWMDAHSLYVEELAAFGVIGAASIFAALTLGLTLTIVSAWKGFALPAAVFILYLLAGITDLLHDGWSVISIPLLIVMLGVLATRPLPFKFFSKKGLPHE